MPWNEDDNSDHSSGQPTAGDYARQMQSHASSILAAAGHRTCEYLKTAKYVPESGAVVCGCGEFEPWSDDVDRPPWEPGEPDGFDGFDGPIGDGQQGPAGPPPARRGGTTLAEAADPIRSTLALIDPTQVYTPEDVERHILDTLYRLETGALFERETVIKAWETAQAFEVKYNAFMAVATGGASDQRKAQVMVDCEPEHRAMLEAKMLKEAVKQTMHNLRAVLSGYQSTARSVGSAYQGGGSQGAPPPRDRSPW